MFSYLNPLPQLPKYQGPFKVGSCEYEIPVSEIASDIQSPDTNITTIKFRIYYPTTPSAKSKSSIPWLPTPQKEGNRAYAKFLGLSERSSGFIANMPSMLSYPTIPAVHEGPLSSQSMPFPVAVFSHGLGGNFNTYSSFVGSLASCGVIVFAPEHRDQSAPISFIRSSQKGPARPVPYRRLSHTPSIGVLNARNAMLRIRLWEMEKLFAAISKLNQGTQFTNLADAASEQIPSFENKLDLSPSKVTWAGHSFGAATVVQFVKSIYYRDSLPALIDASEDGWDYAPLYAHKDNVNLAAQITPESPMILLDVWTMPLTAKSTNWLWQRPLPCYDRQDSAEASPNVVSIMSTQFYKWPEMVNRTKALLSENPVQTYKQLTKTRNPEQDAENLEQAEAKGPSPQLSLDPITKLETSKTVGLARSQAQDIDSLDIDVTFNPPSEASTRTHSPAPSAASSDTGLTQLSDTSTNSSMSSLADLPTTDSSGVAPQLYLIPTSAHLSQSDFGVLFPNVTKYLLQTIEPEKIMELNVRAAAAAMRNCGIQVSNLRSTVGPELKENDRDKILLPGVIDEALWTRIQFSA